MAGGSHWSVGESAVPLDSILARPLWVVKALDEVLVLLWKILSVLPSGSAFWRLPSCLFLAHLR